MIKLKTTSVTIRVPEELVDTIDKWVMPNGSYTSRPDFVVSGIRYMVDFIGIVLKELFRKHGEAGLSLVDLSWIEGEMKELHDMTQSKYSKYKGKPIAITLRLSPILIDRIDKANSIGPKYENLQDFVRGSIILYSDTRDVRSISERLFLKHIYDARENRKVGTVVKELVTGGEEVEQTLIDKLQDSENSI